MHLAVLDANTDDSPLARRHPDEAGKFAALLSPVRPGWTVTGVQVKASEFPARVDAFDGYIVSGSPASVNDPLPWIAALAGLIRAAVARGVPVYGACFGHQMIAAALGGRVGPNPGGWVMGRVDTVLTPPWDGRPQELSLYAAHQEQVLELPAGAIVTGQGPGCACGGLALGGRVWSTQYHPEMTPDFVADMIADYADVMPAPVIARARASMDRPAHKDRIAALIAGFFDRAGGAAAGATATVAQTPAP